MLAVLASWQLCKITMTHPTLNLRRQSTHPQIHSPKMISVGRTRAKGKARSEALRLSPPLECLPGSTLVGRWRQARSQGLTPSGAASQPASPLWSQKPTWSIRFPSEVSLRKCTKVNLLIPSVGAPFYFQDLGMSPVGASEISV